MPSLWYARVTSFRGIAINATHFYVGLSRMVPRVQFDILHVLSEEEAAELREKDQWDFWKAGETTNRFDHESEAIEAARVAWKNLSANDDALLLGNSSSAEPQPVLEGPRDFKILGNRLHDQCEEIGWWDGPESGVFEGVPYQRDEAMDALCRHWNLLVNAHGLGEHDYESLNPDRTVRVRRGERGWVLDGVD